MGIAITSNTPTLSSTSAQQISASLVPEGTLHFATDTMLLTRATSGGWVAVPVGPLNLVADPQSFGSSGGTVLYQQSHEIVGTTATTATVNLPAALLGRRLRLHQVGAGTTTFARQSSDTIDGGASIALASGRSVELICTTLGAWRSVPIANIADGAVTPGKRSTALQVSAQRAAGSNDLLGTSYSSYMTTGNLACTGRPVLVVADITMNNAGSGSIRPVDVQIVMDGVAQGPARTFELATDNAKESFALVALVSAPTAGNRVFALQARCPSSGAAVAIREGLLVAIEL